jgi:hypothetical protein
MRPQRYLVLQFLVRPSSLMEAPRRMVAVLGDTKLLMLDTQDLEHLGELLESHRVWDRWELVVECSRRHNKVLLDRLC